MPNVLIRRECPFCEKTHIRSVPAEGWTAYNNGVLNQDSMGGDEDDD